MIIISKWNQDFGTIIVYNFETIESVCLHIQSSFRAHQVKSIKTVIGHRNRHLVDVSPYIVNRRAADQIHWNLP